MSSDDSTVVPFPAPVSASPSPPPVSPVVHELMLSLEHEIADLNAHIAFQSCLIRQHQPAKVIRRVIVASLVSFIVGWALDPPLGVVLSRTFNPGVEPMKPVRTATNTPRAGANR